MPESLACPYETLAAAPPKQSADAEDFVGPPRARYESLGHIVEEMRTAGHFEVHDPRGQVVGWIVRAGGGFQARGFAASFEEAPTLRTFASGRAALRLVIGYRDFTRLKQVAIEDANKIEREYLSKHPEVAVWVGADRVRP